MTPPRTIGSYRFAIAPSGRCGCISCESGARRLELDWEMSGVPEHDILLAPVNLAAWASGELIPKEQQMEILLALRVWLASKRIKSDIAPNANVTIGTSKCMWSGCQESAMLKSAYCAKHWDENLLR